MQICKNTHSKTFIFVTRKRLYETICNVFYLHCYVSCFFFSKKISFPSFSFILTSPFFSNCRGLFTWIKILFGRHPTSSNKSTKTYQEVGMNQAFSRATFSINLLNFFQFFWLPTTLLLIRNMLEVERNWTAKVGMEPVSLQHWNQRYRWPSERRDIEIRTECSSQFVYLGKTNRKNCVRANHLKSLKNNDIQSKIDYFDLASWAEDNWSQVFAHHKPGISGPPLLSTRSRHWQSIYRCTSGKFLSSHSALLWEFINITIQNSIVFEQKHFLYKFIFLQKYDDHLSYNYCSIMEY